MSIKKMNFSDFKEEKRPHYNQKIKIKNIDVSLKILYILISKKRGEKKNGN